jgi:site-specific DNA recombinase
LAGKKPVPPENAAVIYSRFSTENQKETSIDAQERACEEYAKKKGLEIVGRYADRAKSGTNAEKREQFQKMLSDSANGLFSCVLVFSIDRFARDLRDYLNSRHDLLENGVRVRSATEGIGDDLSGQIIAAVLMLNAQMYVTNLSKHVRKNQRETALKGLHVGGPVLYGFKVNSEREYVPNEEEAPVVRKIFEMYASGKKSYHEILEHLDSLGIRTRQGEKFKVSTLYDILRNEKYIGKYKYGVKQDPNSETDDKQIVIEDRIEKIIDVDLFNKVRERLAQNKINAGRHKAKRNYLLSGIIRCGECDTPMQGNTRKNSKGKSAYSSYDCPNRKTCGNRSVRRRLLERFVFGKLYEHLLPSVSLDRLTAMMNEHIKKQSAKSPGEISKEKLELKKIEKQIGNLVNHMKNGDKSDAARNEVANLENRKRIAEGRIEEMKSRHNVAPISKETVADLLCQSRKILRRPNDKKHKDLAKSVECRNFVNSYVESVLVFGDKIKAKFKIKRPQNTPKTEPEES